MKICQLTMVRPFIKETGKTPAALSRHFKCLMHTHILPMQPGFDSSIVNSITVAFISMHGTLCFFFLFFSGKCSAQ